MLAVSSVVLKQVLSGNFLAFAYQSGQAGILQGYVVGHAFFTHKGKVDLTAFNGYVLVVQSGQAVAIVLPGILFITDPNEGLVHEQQHQGHYFFPVEGRAAQVFVELFAQRGQLFAKGVQARKLGQATHFVPGRVVAVLLTTQAVEARHLQVRGGRRRNPDLGPGRRNHKAGNPVQDFRVGYFQALDVVVSKISGTGDFAGQTRALVGGITQAGHLGLAGRVFVEDVRLFLRH